MRAVLARTTIDAETGEILEDRAIMVGAGEKKSNGTRPGITAECPTMRTVTTLWYDPEYRKPKGSWFMGRYFRAYSGSGTPGLWPELRKRANDVERARIIAVWKAQKLGAFVEPCGTADAQLLGQIGGHDAAPADSVAEEDRDYSAGTLVKSTKSIWSDEDSIIAVPTDCLSISFPARLR